MITKKSNGATENGFFVDEQETMNTDCDLEYIGSLVAEGFMSGYYPYWKLFLTGVYHEE